MAQQDSKEGARIIGSSKQTPNLAQANPTTPGQDEEKLDRIVDKYLQSLVDANQTSYQKTVTVKGPDGNLIMRDGKPLTLQIKVEPVGVSANKTDNKDIAVNISGSELPLSEP